MSPGSKPPRKPERPPRDYLRGSWPDSLPRRLTEEEGGDAVEFMAEQAARIAGQIKARRIERGWHRSELARRTGLRPNTIGDVEEGRSWSDMRTLSLIAWALSVDIEMEPRYSLRARAPAAEQEQGPPVTPPR